MLIVKLAGYNVDTDVLEKLKTGGWDKKNNITPETISAAYARISRDPRPVTGLRADSREEVDRARKSNENIVFKMGHHSVAEHALLNFDILGLSRLAVEALEEARLCSYTEKSQRYITLEGDFVTPAEYSGEDKKTFHETTALQVEAYKKLFPLLHEYQKNKNPGMLGSNSGQNTIEGWAKEDARYVLSMATECQLGFSANARNLEYIIRKLKYHPLDEVRGLGGKLYENARTIVPSLIILSDPEAFKKQFGMEVSDGILAEGRQKLSGMAGKLLPGNPEKENPEVTLLDHTNEPDAKIIAALLHSSSDMPYSRCLLGAVKMGKDGQNKFMKELLGGLGGHDALFREFETAGFLFEIILSSSAFAQMKRHRMMTLLKQPYDPALGFTIPPSVSEIKQEALFKDIMEKSERAFEKLSKENKAAAGYVLTNAHRRRILINADLREIYHMARLRMDSHAQWDIRNITAEMVRAVKKAAPASAALACGKDEFGKVKKDFLNQ